MNNPTPTAPSRVRKHWFMVTMEAHYRKEGKAVMKRMNILLQSPTKNIIATTLRDINEMTYMQLEQQFEIPKSDVFSAVILNMVHMGHMTEVEYLKNADA